MRLLMSCLFFVNISFACLYLFESGAGWPNYLTMVAIVCCWSYAKDFNGGEQ